MSIINEKFYREIRCENCRKLLGYEYVFAGRLAFFCSRCNEITELNFKHMQSKENTDTIKSEFSFGGNTIETEILKKGGE